MALEFACTFSFLWGKDWTNLNCWGGESDFFCFLAYSSFSWQMLGAQMWIVSPEQSGIHTASSVTQQVYKRMTFYFLQWSRWISQQIHNIEPLCPHQYISGLGKIFFLPGETSKRGLTVCLTCNWGQIQQEFPFYERLIFLVASLISSCTHLRSTCPAKQWWVSVLTRNFVTERTALSTPTSPHGTESSWFTRSRWGPSLLLPGNRNSAWHSKR